MNVTNGADESSVALTGATNPSWGGNSRSNVFTITAIPGVNSPSHVLNVPLSTGWTSTARDGIAYYTNDSISTTYSKTFSFTVPAGTPADAYNLVMKVAGTDGNAWTQATPITLTVTEPVPEPATLAMILGGALVGFVCWRGRKYVKAE